MTFDAIGTLTVKNNIRNPFLVTIDTTKMSALSSFLAIFIGCLATACKTVNNIIML